jgi:hypothetical protein
LTYPFQSVSVPISESDVWLDLDLKAPPNLLFMKSLGSTYLLNRTLRLAYKLFRDYGDGSKYVLELKNKIPEVVIQFLWVNPLDPHYMSCLETNIEAYQVRASNSIKPGIRLP